MKETYERIGSCAVDSGQIMFVDPCYIESVWSDGSYDEVCEATLSDRQAGVVLDGLAVATSTAYGDGEYPVFVERAGRNGRIMSVTIQFDADARGIPLSVDTFDDTDFDDPDGRRGRNLADETLGDL